MGPVTLFDKSFIQGLSIDESVWFDHFFLTNVAPLFFAETLADLAKVVPGGAAETEVSKIADKFPDMHGTPNMHHQTLAVADLCGHPVPMTGQIIVSGGRPVRSANLSGFIIDNPPEREAFSRWQRRQFASIEQDFARRWRLQLANLDLGQQSELFRAVGVSPTTCSSLQQAKSIAASVVETPDDPEGKMRLLAHLLGLNPDLERLIASRFRSAGYPPLQAYAPYAAFVLTVDLFFHVALAARLIGSDRPSNRIDIAYLYYLPFCMMFVSSDTLHRRCAPLFLREDQDFVWGVDLKADLSALNRHFLALPESVRKGGLLAFASEPPKDQEHLVSRLWDRHLPTWREGAADLPLDPAVSERLTSTIRELLDAPSLPPQEVDFDDQSATMLSLTRSVRRKKGSWWQVPYDLEE